MGFSKDNLTCTKFYDFGGLLEAVFFSELRKVRNKSITKKAGYDLIYIKQ